MGARYEAVFLPNAKSPDEVDREFAQLQTELRARYGADKFNGQLTSCELDIGDEVYESPHAADRVLCELPPRRAKAVRVRANGIEQWYVGGRCPQ